METYPIIPRISREQLSSLILESPSTLSEIAIVDVRDSDHVGGHIISSVHRPSSSLSYLTPDLVQELRNKKTVIFHCALSQVRGPGAALKYLGERKRLLGRESIVSDVPVSKPKADNAADVEVNKDDKVRKGEEMGEGKQQVYVLEGGFVKWQEEYGTDKQLTDKYDEEIWKYGYDG